MSKRYDVVATTGTYMAGNEKKYVNRRVGAVIDTQNGPALVLDSSFNPAGCKVTEDGKVWLKLFEPRADDRAQQAAGYSQGQPSGQQPPAQGGYGGFDDEEPPF